MTTRGQRLLAWWRLARSENRLKPVIRCRVCGAVYQMPHLPEMPVAGHFLDARTQAIQIARINREYHCTHCGQTDFEPNSAPPDGRVVASGVFGAVLGNAVGGPAGAIVSDSSSVPSSVTEQKHERASASSNRGSGCCSSGGGCSRRPLVLAVEAKEVARFQGGMDCRLRRLDAARGGRNHSRHRLARGVGPDSFASSPSCRRRRNVGRGGIQVVLATDLALPDPRPRTHRKPRTRGRSCSITVRSCSITVADRGSWRSRVAKTRRSKTP